MLAVFLAMWAGLFAAHANDGVYFVSGSHLEPLQETDISVKKEVLTITISDGPFAFVEVEYEFMNNGQPKDVTMGFEAKAPYNDGEPMNLNGIHPYINDFSVVMNGQTLSHRNGLVFSEGFDGELPKEAKESVKKGQRFFPVDFNRWKLDTENSERLYNEQTEEYADYLKIVNEVAAMHPELIKGYNAHGQAILKNNKAVEEAIDLEKKQQKEAEAQFTTTDSLDKLIASRETTKRWQVAQGQLKRTQGGHGAAYTLEDSKLKQDSQAVIDNIKKLDNGKEILSQLESDFELTTGALTNLTDEGIKAIQDHGDAMLSTVQGEYAGATDKTTKNLVESIQNSIAQVGKDTKGIEEVTEPIYRALSTYASRQGLFDNIPEEFREAAETGIKEVSKLSIDEKTGAKLSGADMQARVREVTQAVENLNGHSDEYQQALSEMDSAQQQFGKDLDKGAYGEAIASNIGALMK